jgi:protein-tyrosine phosphatase
MSSDFHFGPARHGEPTVYGARAPGSSLNSILEWTRFMREQGVSRVCCLLDPEQLATFSIDLGAEYKRQFGADRVLMWPVKDHHLCSPGALAENILPFLRTADVLKERAVVHCWGGNGRAGHVLAAWLVAARGIAPQEALDAVQDEGRLPQEAVLAGNATMDELVKLLAGCRSASR